MKKILKLIYLIILICFISGCGGNTPPNEGYTSDLKVYYINVGQADCTLIMLPNNETILIDAGLDHATSFDENDSNQDITYDVKPGIFKSFCEETTKQMSDLEAFDSIWEKFIKENSEIGSAHTCSAYLLKTRTQRRKRKIEEQFITIRIQYNDGMTVQDLQDSLAILNEAYST